MKFFIALLVATAACADPSAIAGASTDPLTFTHPDETISTSCDTQCDTDAKVLTLRYQSEILLNDDLQSDYDWMLRKARVAVPATCSVSAATTSDPTSIAVEPLDEQITTAWQQGATTTGVDAVDSPLSTIGIASIDTSDASFDVFVVHFKQPVNVVVLVAELNATQEVTASTNDYNTTTTQDITATTGDQATLLTFTSQTSGATTVNVTNAGVVTAN